MSSYVITIAPDDGVGTQTTVRVDIDGGTTTIKEFTVRPTPGSSLAATAMPNIDIDMLLRAVQPPPGTPHASPEVQSDTPTTTGRRARPRKAASRRLRLASTDGATSAAAGRAYRRMPDDLEKVLAKAGTITALAASYGVPRHTAQGWINRLRKQNPSS